MILVLSILFHLLFVAFWIGGMLFLPLVLLPAIKDHPDRIKLLYQTGLRFRFYGWWALGGIFLTGLLNLLAKGIPFEVSYFMQSSYGHWILVKVLLFILTMALGYWHDQKLGQHALDEIESEKREHFRKWARWSGRLTLLVALAAALIGVMLSRGSV